MQVPGYMTNSIFQAYKTNFSSNFQPFSWDKQNDSLKRWSEITFRQIRLPISAEKQKNESKMSRLANENWKKGFCGK